MGLALKDFTYHLSLGFNNNKLKMMRHYLFTLFFFGFSFFLSAQILRIPDDTNFSCSVGRRIGKTQIDINWNAPGVKGREGKIWGTNVAYYGYEVLGFGSDVLSPWRAGADEATTISFSTDVMINGKRLSAGRYALFMGLSSDSTEIIFNANDQAWGSYFYDKNKDILSVKVKQEKDLTTLVERLEYKFLNQKENAVDVALEWERWRISFTVSIDLKKNVLASIKSQMVGAIGFDPPSLSAAARWCMNNDVNLEEALHWVSTASSPSLGGQNSFTNATIKAGILEKMNKQSEADAIMNASLDNANVNELHMYGRQLLQRKKLEEAFKVFELNFKKHNGAWPSHVGMMRAYDAKGDYIKALEHAKLALTQAQDDINKRNLTDCIAKLEKGKSIN